MYPRRLLICLGLAAFVGSLVVLAPARLLLSLTPTDSSLRSAQVSGSLLQGRLQTAGHSPLSVEWTWQPGWLLTLGLCMRWQATHPDFQGSGDLIVRPWHYAITLEDGTLAPARLARGFGSDGGVVLDQPLRLKEFSVGGIIGMSIGNAEGELAWGPGSVSLRNRAEPLQVPALRGQLTTDAGVVNLTVDGAAAPGATLATATIDLSTRELHLLVLARAAEELGLATERRQSPDTVFFELRQPLR